MQILHSTPSAPDYIPPPELAPRQIICGPEYPDRRHGPRTVSLRTPSGAYDIAAVAARLPKEQRPDLLVVRIDAIATNMPRNLAALGCRTVLVVGDTHHRIHPVSRLLDYALSETFDAVILDYTRQHAHFFIEAGLGNVFWLPGFNVRRLPIERTKPPDIPLSFVGSVAELHPRRAAFCEALRGARLPLQVLKGTAGQSRLLHARTRVNLNISLNGDLNLRVFEVLASGGFLLTDRLGGEAGLDLLFADGEHLVTFTDLDDCIAKARRSLADPERARAIALAGKARYEEFLSPERIRRDFFDLVQGGTPRAEFDLGRDRRHALGRETDRAALFARIGLYEIVQELHRRRERATLLATPSADPRFLADIADLPRLAIAVDAREPTAATQHLHETLAKAGLGERVRFVTDGTPSADIVALTAAECDGGAAALARSPDGTLLVTDLAGDMAAPRAEAAKRTLAARGFDQIAATVPLFGRRP